MRYRTTGPINNRNELEGLLTCEEHYCRDKAHYWCRVCNFCLCKRHVIGHSPRYKRELIKYMDEDAISFLWEDKRKTENSYADHLTCLRRNITQ